jgi:hypothetical protein
MPLFISMIVFAPCVPAASTHPEAVSSNRECLYFGQQLERFESGSLFWEHRTRTLAKREPHDFVVWGNGEIGHRHLTTPWCWWQVPARGQLYT